MRASIHCAAILIIVVLALAGCNDDVGSIGGCPPQPGRVTIFFETGVSASRATSLLDSLELVFYPSLHDAFLLVVRAVPPDTVSQELLASLMGELRARSDSSAHFTPELFEDSLGAGVQVYCHDL